MVNSIQIFTKLVLLLFVTNIHDVKSENCTLPPIYPGTWFGEKVGDQVDEGITVTILCPARKSLRNVTQLELPCVETAIPAGCRELSISSTQDKYIVGTTAAVTCNVYTPTKAEVKEITFTRDGEALETFTSFDSSTSVDGGKQTLYIKAYSFTTTPDSSGEYGCVAKITSSSGSSYEKSSVIFEIQVADIEMLPSEKINYVFIGDKVTLICSAPVFPLYVPTITWDVKTDDAAQKIETSNGRLISTVITTATTEPSYSGDHSCKLVYVKDNIRLEQTKIRTIEVRGITQHPQNTLKEVGATAEFTCKAVAEKQVQFTWFVGTAEQDSSISTPAYTSADRLSSSVLVLTNVQEQDTSITCRVAFAPDTVKDASVAKLKVLKMEFYIKLEDTVFTLKSRRAELKCGIRTNPVNNLDITWYKDDTSLPPADAAASRNQEGTEHYSILSVNSGEAQLEDAGTYHCIGRHTSYGTSITIKSDTVNVYVRGLEQKPAANEFRVLDGTGQRTDFTCTYKGDGESGIGITSLNWFQEGVSVTGLEGFDPQDKEYIPSTNSRASVLTVSKPQPTRAGTLECRASFGFGDTISVFYQYYVHLTYPLPGTSYVKKGSAITCKIGTNTPGQAYWYVDNVINNLNNKFSRDKSYTKDGIQYDELLVTGFNTFDSPRIVKCTHQFHKTNKEYSTSTRVEYRGFNTVPSKYNYREQMTMDVQIDYYFDYTFSKGGPSGSKWYKDGTEITDTRMSIKEATQSGSYNTRLILKRQDNFDIAINDYSGVYKTTVEFSDASYSSESTWIFYELTSSNEAPTFTYDVESYTMSCTLKAAKIEIEKVQWVRVENNINIPIDDDDGTYTTSFTDNVARLTITKVVQRNEGVFKCKFFLPGDHEIEARNQIEIRNIDMEGSSDMGGKLGESLRMKCKAGLFTTSTDLNLPKIRWYKDGTWFTEASVTTSKESRYVYSSTMTITDLGLTDAGTYKCGIDDFRSAGSINLSLVSIENVGTTVEKGSDATVSCVLSDTTVEPTEVYWRDGTGVQYKEGDSSSEYTVTNTEYQGNSMTTAILLKRVEEAKPLTCVFLIGGATNSRGVTVDVIDVVVHSDMVIHNSPGLVKCDITGLTGEPDQIKWRIGATDLADGDSYKITSSPLSQTKITTQLTVASVKADTVYTCAFDVADLKVTREVDLKVYQVTVPDLLFTMKGGKLELSVDVTPDTGSLASLVRDLSVLPSLTRNGDPVISGMDITFSEVVVPMDLTINFKDNKDAAHSRKSKVAVGSFGKHVISLTDTTEDVKLTCILDDVPQEFEDAVSMFWEIDGNYITQTPTYEGGAMKSTYNYKVASDFNLPSMDITCGSEVSGTKYQHKAVIELVTLTMAETLTLNEGKAGAITCTVTGSETYPPKYAIWYHGTEQVLKQSLEQQSTWPDPVVLTLSDITQGSYTVVVNYGVAEFQRTISVKVTGDGDGDGNGEDGDDGDDSSKSGSNTAVIVGISVPVIIILVFCIAIAYVCLKRRLQRRPSRSYNISPSNIPSNTYRTPSSLIYHNQTVGNSNSRVSNRHDAPNPHPKSSQLELSGGKPGSPPRPNRPTRPRPPRPNTNPNFQIRFPQDTEI